MSIEHSEIEDPQIHEPKGASSAASKTIYISDGAGSGAWNKIDSDSLKGLSSHATNTNLKIVTNGASGFSHKKDAAYGGMYIENNTSQSISATAVADSTLNTSAQYSGINLTFTANSANYGNVVHGSGYPWNLLLPAGVYKLDLWATISTFPSNTAKIGLKFAMNGTLSTKKVVVKANSGGDYGLLVANDIITVPSGGTTITLHYASTVTGTLLFDTINLTAVLLRE